MATSSSFLLSKFAIFTLYIFHVGAVKVQFFMEESFEGEMHESYSSTNCQNLPTSRQKVGGSIRTSGCIAVFTSKDCLDWGNKIITEESQLSRLEYKYKNVESRGYKVTSFRDCTDLEDKSQVNLDYYEKDYFRGKLNQFRDVCGCTNMPFSIEDNWKSAKTYGNCFKVYKTRDCMEKPDYVTQAIQHFSINWKSVEPCNLPKYCRKITASIYNIEPSSHIMKVAGTLQNVPIADKQTFINNGPESEDFSYDAFKKITEIVQFEFPNVFSSMDQVTFDEKFGENFQADVPFILNASVIFKEDLLNILQTRRSNAVLKYGIESNNEFRVQTIINMASCSKYEIAPYVEMVENAEVPYRIQFKLTGEKSGDEKMSQLELRESFRGIDVNFLNSTNDHSVLVESAGKLILTYVVITGIDTTSTQMPGCRHNFPYFIATILNFEPLTNLSNSVGNTRNFPITSKRTYINNGSAAQEDNFEVSNEFIETAQFAFPKELGQMGLINFENVDVDDFERNVPFLTTAWEIFLDRFSKSYTESNEKLKYTVSNRKKFRVQKKMSVPPCTKYEVSSFVEMAKNVEIVYNVRIKVTGKLGFKAFRSNELRSYLKHFTLLNDVSTTDDSSVLVETTMRVKLTYGAATGVSAVSTPLLECIETQVAAIANCTFTCL